MPFAGLSELLRPILAHREKLQRSSVTLCWVHSARPRRLPTSSSLPSRR